MYTTFLKISGLLLLPMLVTGLALWSLLADELEWEWEGEMTPVAFFAAGVDESDPDALFLAAKTAVSDNDYPQAEQYLYQAIALRPKTPLLHHQLGTVLAQQGHTAEAIAAYQTALTLDDSRLTTASSLSRLYIQQGNVAAAQTILRQTVAKRVNIGTRCPTEMACVS